MLGTIGGFSSLTSINFSDMKNLNIIAKDAFFNCSHVNYISVGTVSYPNSTTPFEQ